MLYTFQKINLKQFYLMAEEKLYLMESGNVIEITKSNERIDIFSPTNTDKINLNNFSISLYICALFIMIFMIFDDYLTIKAVYRLIFQIFVTFDDNHEWRVSLSSRKYFGFGEINLGVFSIPFTIFCVVGLMNAFNMIDGLNGICASLALIPIMYVTFLGNFSYGLLIPIGAILVF